MLALWSGICQNSDGGAGRLFFFGPRGVNGMSQKEGKREEGT